MSNDLRFNNIVQLSFNAWQAIFFMSTWKTTIRAKVYVVLTDFGECPLGLTQMVAFDISKLAERGFVDWRDISHESWELSVHDDVDLPYTENKILNFNHVDCNDIAFW